MLQLVELGLHMHIKIALLSLPARSQAHRISSQDVGCKVRQNNISRKGRLLDACFNRDTLLLVLAMAGEFQEHRLG